jgi:ketosteroid isomerase-like protein
MSIEANKAAALAIVHGAVKGRLDRAALTDDAVWWMQGSRELPIDDFMEMNRSFHADLIGGDVRLAVHGITAEGDRVAVEAECFVPLKKGGVYHSTYHFLIRFRDGKACLVKEYFDTARARDALRSAE